MSGSKVKEISVFVDESGSYDSDVSSSLYYMVCLVFHDQDSDLTADIKKLEEAQKNFRDLSARRREATRDREATRSTTF